MSEARAAKPVERWSLPAVEELSGTVSEYRHAVRTCRVRGERLP